MAAAVRRSGVHWEVDDIVSKAVSELTERITSDPHAFPASWFETAPGDRGQDDLRPLATTVARRRALDMLRRHYLSSRLAEPAKRVEEPEQRLLARALLRRLAALIDTLPAEDRELLATPLTDSGSLSTAERVRLHRIRRRLRDAATTSRPGNES